MKKAHKILLLYSFSLDKMRSTNAEHLFSFQKHAPCPVTYVNLAKEELPPLRQLRQFDMVLFHCLFVQNHWAGPASYRDLMRRARPVLRTRAVKVALIQDEFYHPELYAEFFNEFGLNCVFSVVPPSEWPKIFPTVDSTRVHFFPSMTGYIDESIVKMCGHMCPDKDIDIGYRTSAKPYFWFGRHGYLKQQIADAVLELNPKFNLKLDISTRDQDTILGEAWYEFLARCKYTIGVESGTSIVDRDGSLHQLSMEFTRTHPNATFEEAEAAFFPGRDGEVRLFALGPRHLEACITRTCQILTEGDYNGVLRPWEHYIPVRKDFSNLTEVLDLVKMDSLRHDIVERAYHDIVASQRYSYRHFVEYVIETSMRHYGENNLPRFFNLRESIKDAKGRAQGIKEKAKRVFKRIAKKILAGS